MGVRRIVMFGPPGVGKGTQAERLAAKLEIPHISTGDMFRDNLKRETDLGKQARTYMDAGKLVPDEVTVAMVRERLSRPDAQNGFLLDGFPRTVPQAESLQAISREISQPIECVIDLQAPDEIVVERLSGRRVSREGGHLYHLRFNPPKVEGVCDKTGSELYQRDDDKPEVIRQRLTTYHEQTAPVLAWYQQAHRVESIDGTQSPDEVTAAILQKIQ